MQIKHIALGMLLVALILLVGFLLYRSQSGSNLNVTPDAAEEIEKAKRR